MLQSAAHVAHYPPSAVRLDSTFESSDQPGMRNPQRAGRAIGSGAEVTRPGGGACGASTGHAAPGPPERAERTGRAGRAWLLRNVTPLAATLQTVARVDRQSLLMHDFCSTRHHASLAFAHYSTYSCCSYFFLSAVLQYSVSCGFLEHRGSPSTPPPIFYRLAHRHHGTRHTFNKLAQARSGHDGDERPTGHGPSPGRRRGSRGPPGLRDAGHGVRLDGRERSERQGEAGRKEEEEGARPDSRRLWCV